MAKHRRARHPAPFRPRHRLAAALRGGGVVVALVGGLLAGAKLMSFAAGPSGGGHAAAIGRSRSDLGPRSGTRHHRRSVHAETSRSSPAATPPARVAGQSVTAVGDSVMVAATPALDAVLPGIYINAMVGRQFSTGLDVIAQLKSQGLLRPIVVVGLGTNGTITDDEIRQLFAEIGAHRRLVLVNTFEDRSWEQEVNSAFAAAAAAHPATVVLADWFGTIEHRTYLLWPDGIHPQPAGGVVYARMLKSAVDKVASLPG